MNRNNFSIPAPITAPRSRSPLTVYYGQTVAARLQCNARDVDGRVVSCRCHLNKYVFNLGYGYLLWLYGYGYLP